MTSLRLAALNLTRRRIPTMIAVLSIAISVAVSGILLRMVELSQSRFTTLGAGGDAIVGAKAGGLEILLGALNSEGRYPGYLPYKLYQSLHDQERVVHEDGSESNPDFIRAIIPFVYFAKFHKFRVAGTDETFFQRPNIDDTLMFAQGRWSSDSDTVVLGARVAQKYNLHIGDSVSSDLWIGPDPTYKTVSLKITGILESTHTAWDRMLFSNITTAQKSLGMLDLHRTSIWGPNVLNYFLVYLGPRGFGPLAALINGRTVGQAIDVQNQLSELKALSGTGEKIGLFVTILILLLGGLSVTSMLITRFEAMFNQIAVLRAIGYTRRTLGLWLIWEGLLLGLAACLIGGLLDFSFFPLMRHWMAESLPPPELVASSVWQSYPIWIIALAATVASVFIPLYRVYRQDVHFALRN